VKRYLILFPLCVLAADLNRPRIIDTDHALEIQHCHPGDRAILHVQPLPSETDDRRSGWMTTTNTRLGLQELTMFPRGTNLLEIQTVCSGATSPMPLTMLIVIRRPPPPPKVELALARPWNIPAPPLPGGLTLPLPGAVTNHESYKAYRARLDAALNDGARRSQ
jgi:hypothetical protein